MRPSSVYPMVLEVVPQFRCGNDVRAGGRATSKGSRQALLVFFEKWMPRSTIQSSTLSFFVLGLNQASGSDFGSQVLVLLSVSATLKAVMIGLKALIIWRTIRRS